MSWNRANGDVLRGRGPSRWKLFLLSLGIATFLLLIAYIVKTFSAGNVETNNDSLSTDCTLYASPSGVDSNSGLSSAYPKSPAGAASAAGPGSVVCLLTGTYNLSSSFTPPKSGTSSAWIVYKSYGKGTVNFVWTGPADASAMFKIGSGDFPSGPAYLEFRGLNLDGKGNAADGFFCRGSHHLRFIDNTISNTGGSGIASINCDYLVADHNLIHHNGYIPTETKVPENYSWTSGISFNSAQWFDSYIGFHSVISNNVVAGQIDESSHHSDGNGIILDLSNGTYDPSTANTPPALILNNVVYGNGGRCITAYVVTNFWIVNNTCYKNNLDSALEKAGSFTTNDSKNGYFINNIAVASQSDSPAYNQENSNSNILYFSNMYYGASNNLAHFDAAQLIQADPMFVNPPIFHPSTPRQYEAALHPSQLGTGLTLSRSSPAIAKGIDPSTLPNLPPAIVTDLKKYIYKDIQRNPRSAERSFDLGAYQHRP